MIWFDSERRATSRPAPNQLSMAGWPPAGMKMMEPVAHGTLAVRTRGQPRAGLCWCRQARKPVGPGCSEAPLDDAPRGFGSTEIRFVDQVST